VIHPIPVPFMDQRELRKGRIARRSTVDPDKDEAAGSSPARPTKPAPDQRKRWSAVVRVWAGLDHPIRDEVNRGPKPTSPSTSLTSDSQVGWPFPWRRTRAQRSETHIPFVVPVQRHDGW
jgi:hypothetical protein